MARRDDHPKAKLTGPWRSVHGAIWLLGLAALAASGWWWPGILVLVALSTLAEAGISTIPGATAPEQTEQPVNEPSTTLRTHDPARLPVRCEACGAPVEPAQAQWTSAVTARCSYCGANLQMK